MTEIVTLLDTTAGAADAQLRWNRNLPVGVSKAQHYEGFAEVVAIGRQIIYNRTKDIGRKQGRRTRFVWVVIK